MYLNQLPRAQWKYLQYLLQVRQLQLLRRHINIGAKPPIQTANRLPARRRVHLINGDLQDRFVAFRNQDAVLNRLKEAKTTDQLLELLKSSDNLQGAHVAEGISQLWQSYQGMDQLEKEALTERVLKEALPMLGPHIGQLEVNDLSRCYLYLRKMHISNSEPAVEAVLMRALELIEGQVHGETIPLTALSRLSVGINLERDFFTPLVCINFVPHLDKHICQCHSEEQVRLLSTCLFQLHFLIDDELLSRFKERISELLQSGVLSSKTPKALLKVLHMLNIPLWSQHHTQLIREVMLALRPCVHQMESADLKSICRAFLHHQEPAALREPLKEATEKLLQEESTADALSCAVPFATPLQRDKCAQLFRTLLYSEDAWLLPNASGHFFSVLRALKISDLGVCNTYWSGVIRELESCQEEQTHLRFLRHCQRYMNFNNNLGGTYRHFELERKLSRMCMKAVEEDIAGRLPTKFARLAAFVLAYGQTPLAWKKFPNILLSKMLAMAPQFAIQDCFLLSRGMQIACELRFRQHLPSLAAMQLSTMDSILIDCAERHLANAETDPLSAYDLSMIVRTLSHRKTLKNTMVYNQALLQYKSLHCKDLSSRVVRDMAYNFNASHFFVPELLESMFDYISEQHSHITGDTVEKVLTCSYNLGYTPASLEALNHASGVLIRDFEQMSGLSIVQACLALCFYKSIHEQLINQIFCVKFIQRIEDEIQVCYSKATYPERVLNLVMQLNRTVCLDFPEANVPWFQQNYIEAQLSKNSLFTSGPTKEVKQLLQKLLQNDNHFRCNHTTPYGYQIDFVIHFDRNRKPIPAPPMEATMLDRITKVAILLLKFDSFCENDLTALRGPDSLKMRHLEMMGYKVMQINAHDWNSKYMASSKAKENYLKCLLKISH
ncbi:FAST kinase domain-containing protein 1, mitochondrial isoform X1 [Drosophila gunungcola]|uniref:FAST kinase domain-containing protein 1, mitochondrial isoform X1 n=1 Tax=Drosophila gunungcola TaxID=103775 RepID=UPI0022E62CAE|nr:FAST kinase domain-containing protein 1, mitochondrial isoform X1 [Drosophila gunungcola]